MLLPRTTDRIGSGVLKHEDEMSCLAKKDVAVVRAIGIDPAKTRFVQRIGRRARA